MGALIMAVGCDPSQEVICTPDSVNEFFETGVVFRIFGFGVTRSVILILAAAVAALVPLILAYRKPRLVPSRFGTAVEGLVDFVREEIAIGVIGPEGIRYFPYLLALFMFVLVGNAFEVMPGINFPITSLIAIPVFLALLTWVVFVAVGLAENGFGYLAAVVWPRSVPLGLRPLVGVIELVSTFVLRPITLAVRLFANLVAGHVMLTLLLVSGVVFVVHVDDIGFRSVIGIGWFALGLAIFVFEFLVIVLQAYIFTLLAAVYIETSLHPQH
jgi:F-type H+-transporting ATPase subunit a